MPNAVATRIMIIRHAEKPDGDAQGVTSHGVVHDGELTVRGWQRAGALAALFAPTDGHFADHRLATPATIFAAAVDPESGSRRPRNTVVPLAEKLGIPIRDEFGKNDTRAAADAALASPGVVLMSWEHKVLHELGNRIIGHRTSSPQGWPDDRFDIILVFERGASGAWRCSQVPQLLLHGDRASPLPMP
jgi:hypothetical protein